MTTSISTNAVVADGRKPLDRAAKLSRLRDAIHVGIEQVERERIEVTDVDVWLDGLGRTQPAREPALSVSPEAERDISDSASPQAVTAHRRWSAIAS